MDTLIPQAPTSPQHWMVDLGGGGVLREAIIIDEGSDLRTHIPSHPANWSFGKNFYSILNGLRTTKNIKHTHADPENPQVKISQSKVTWSIGYRELVFLKCFCVNGEYAELRKSIENWAELAEYWTNMNKF
jgi:hypothetical protein